MDSRKKLFVFIERLNEYNLELVEQPVAYHDIAGLEYVTKHSIVPIMSDESCFNSKDALRLVERRAIDYLNIKLMKCGGIREALKINAICEAAGIEVMLGCMARRAIWVSLQLPAWALQQRISPVPIWMQLSLCPSWHLRAACMWKIRRSWYFRKCPVSASSVLRTSSNNIQMSGGAIYVSGFIFYEGSPSGGRSEIKNIW